MHDLISRQVADVPDTNVGDMIYRRAAIDAIESCEPGEERFMITSLPPAQPERCSDCIPHGGDWECDHMHCRKGRLPSAQPEPEHTMEEFMYDQDLGSPEDGSL